MASLLTSVTRHVGQFYTAPATVNSTGKAWDAQPKPTHRGYSRKWGGTLEITQLNKQTQPQSHLKPNPLTSLGKANVICVIHILPIIREQLTQQWAQGDFKGLQDHKW